GWDLLFSINMPRLNDEVGTPKIARQKGWMPRIDLLEADTHILVRAELAGVPASRVQVAYNPDRHVLILRGERPDDLSLGPYRYQPHLLEIEEGSFSREITLPTIELNIHHVKSQFNNGILNILIPKVGQDPTVIVVEKIT